MVADMISNSGVSGDSPFDRTLHGGAGIPGSDVVVNETGKVYQLGAQVGAAGNVFALDDNVFGAPAVIKLFPRAAGFEAGAVTAFAQTVLRAGKLAAVNANICCGSSDSPQPPRKSGLPRRIKREFDSYWGVSKPGRPSYWFFAVKASAMTS